jgi:anaerobic selenocysteine-containing dehydrogenase
MSESARVADWVLPAASQFEKAEATFFNFEFPQNYFHLRPRLYAPPPGLLPEAEIHARLCEALGVVSEEDYAPLREAARESRAVYAETFMARVMGDPKKSGLAAVLLYRTLGPTLPVELREGAVLYGLALQCAMQHGASLARAGYGGTPFEAASALFDAMLAEPSGIVLAVDEWSGVRSRVSTPSGKLELALDDMLAEVDKLASEPEHATTEFPFVLSAGERRSFTANTILRDPAWRKKDADGALRISPADAEALGVDSGDRVRLVTKRDRAIVSVEVSDTMQPGHVSLPNGLGVDYPHQGAETVLGGIAPNELTAAEDRDPFAGTPWHKHVAARIERV